MPEKDSTAKTKETLSPSPPRRDQPPSALKKLKDKLKKLKQDDPNVYPLF